MKTIVIAVIVAALLALVVCFPWAWDLLKDRTGRIEETAKGKVSDDYLLAQRRAEIEQGFGDLQDSAYKVELIKNKLVDQEATLEAQRRKLAKREGFLQRSLIWVESHRHGDILRVNNKEYGYQTVAKDTEARAKECQASRLAMETLEESVKMLREATADANKGIQQRYIALQQEIVALDAAEMKLTYLGILEETRAFVEGLNLGGAVVSDSRFAKEINNRVAKRETVMKFRGLEVSEKGIVEYPEEFPASELDIARTYAETYLKSRPASLDAPVLIPDEDLADVPSPATP